MASYTHVFTDKETTNWFKSCMALKITKEGLGHFVDSEIQSVHRAVGRSCGQCSIENIVKCPTPGICRNARNCNFHDTQAKRNRQCPFNVCDQVKQNIESHHRHKVPSWKNTKAELWITDHWQIAKCFLPPDGYLHVATVSETDFNGVINVMLNCKDFDNCLSFPVSPQPPATESILTKARQIGRDVRHTSSCKITDADLQDYFQILNTLLSDPACLAQDPFANAACTKLNDLQNERLSISDAELSGLLKDAQGMLEAVRAEKGNLDVEIEKALQNIKQGLDELQTKTDECLKKIADNTKDNINKLGTKSKDGERTIGQKAKQTMQKIAEKAKYINKTVGKRTQGWIQKIRETTSKGLDKIEQTTRDGYQKLAKKSQYGVDTINQTTAVSFDKLNEKFNVSDQTLGIKTQEGIEKIRAVTTQTLEKVHEMGKDVSQNIERKQLVCIETLTETANRGEKTLEETIKQSSRYGTQIIQDKTYDGEQILEDKTVKSIERIQEAKNKQGTLDYETNSKDFLRRLKGLYLETFSTVSLSTLDSSLDKPLSEIYAAPRVYSIRIDKDGKRKTGDQIYKYKDLICKEGTPNKHIFIQGEPGMGKTTFAAKLVLDWCNGSTTSPLLSDESAVFDDVDTLMEFTFLFYIALREAGHQRDISQMIKAQIIDMIYAEDEREEAYKMFELIRKTENSFLLEDGLDEWLDPSDKLVQPSLAGFLKEPTVLITTRPWKLTDERIRNSHIDSLLELDGVNDSVILYERILSCIISQHLSLKIREFKSFVEAHYLQHLLTSPMLNTMVVCTWAQGRFRQSAGLSLCELYTTLLEGLCKKANDVTGFFNLSHKSPVSCFEETEYLQPNINYIEVISKTAFHFLFSQNKEKALVFSDKDLSSYMSKGEKEFALKAGIFTQRKCAIRGTCSFLHKSLQEYFAAFHIATTANVIRDEIAVKLGPKTTDALEISQVFIFVCGFNASAANDLSNLIDKYFDSVFVSPLQEMVVAGFMEAQANKQTSIHLTLSGICLNDGLLNSEALRNIWKDNNSTMRYLSVQTMRPLTVYTNDAPNIYNDLHLTRYLNRKTNSYVYKDLTLVEEQKSLNLSSCHSLEKLSLSGKNITLMPGALRNNNALKELELFCKCDGLDMSACRNLISLSTHTQVTFMPHTICELKGLKFLKISGHCNGLDLSSCIHLESVEVDGHVTFMPNSFRSLGMLKHIIYRGECDSMDLSFCRSLEYLDINTTDVLLPKWICGLDSLKHLKLVCRCDGLDLTSCQSLEHVDISGQVELHCSAQFSLDKLTILKLNCDCKRLDLSSCRNLISIEIEGEVTLVPNAVTRLNKLKELKLHSCMCDGLDLSGSHSLETLAVCWSVTLLPNTLSGAFKLEQLQCFGQFGKHTVDIQKSIPLISFRGRYIIQIPQFLKNISFQYVVCTSHWLHCLFNSLLTVDHQVTCELGDCVITVSEHIYPNEYKNLSIFAEFGWSREITIDDVITTSVQPHISACGNDVSSYLKQDMSKLIPLDHCLARSLPSEKTTNNSSEKELCISAQQSMSKCMDIDEHTTCRSFLVDGKMSSKSTISEVIATDNCLYYPETTPIKQNIGGSPVKEVKRTSGEEMYTFTSITNPTNNFAVTANEQTAENKNANYNGHGILKETTNSGYVEVSTISAEQEMSSSFLINESSSKPNITKVKHTHNCVGASIEAEESSLSLLTNTNVFDRSSLSTNDQIDISKDCYHVSTSAEQQLSKLFTIADCPGYADVTSENKTMKELCAGRSIFTEEEMSVLITSDVISENAETASKKHSIHSGSNDNVSIPAEQGMSTLPNIEESFSFSEPKTRQGPIGNISDELPEPSEQINSTVIASDDCLCFSESTILQQTTGDYSGPNALIKAKLELSTFNYSDFFLQNSDIDENKHTTKSDTEDEYLISTELGMPQAISSGQSISKLMNIDDYLSDSDSVKSTENPLNRFSKDIKISLDREMSKLITIDDCSCNPECTTVNTPTGDVLAKYVSIPAEQGMTEVITMEEYSSFPCDSIDEQCFGNEVISTEHREEIIYIRNPKDLSVPDEFCMSRRTDSNIFPEYPDLTASERNFLCDDYEIFEEKGAHEMYELDDDYLSDIPDSDERKPKAHQSGPALIAKVTAGQGMLEINDDDYPSICPGLWRALCGTNTEYLKLRICHPSNNDDSVIQSETLSSLSKLHTLDICRYYDCPNVWSAVCDVNIRNLSLDLREIMFLK
ncbi:uncharacterized protein LOC127859649 [Dreissena polymorpha]|uniref:uncharacterized protein LOC127859649 n=1 Tax=Dreissena polymorpha TaxID=45954 RepID=UPI002263DA5C|nr:uncharacterized protein LOC127859649 [Dreissena polymorpha]